MIFFMKNILIHGLGQNSCSWTCVKKILNTKGMDVLCPDLFEITKNFSKEYRVVYKKFSDFCNGQEGKLNLCGLSLGGILALDFVKEYPEKVNSVILIGVPYKVPKLLFQLQCSIFCIMPKSVFVKMGVEKKDFVTLVHSMKDLKISEKIGEIKCKTLVLCGAKDNINMKSAKLFKKNIKNSRLEFVESSSHEVNKDNLEALAVLIYKFWKNNKEKKYG